MTIPRGVLLALPLIALLPGCPIWTDDGGGRGRECDVDSECPSGECSLDGFCVPPSECIDDRDCGSGRVCESGTCVPSNPGSCLRDGDCAPGNACVDGSCEPSDACDEDEDCGAGLWCDYRGTCVSRPPGSCRADTECTGGDVCVEGYCRDLDDTCARDRDCAPGNVCLNNECTGTCENDAGCAAGDSCQGGFCRPDNDECVTSSSCGLGEHCIDGRCLPDCRGDSGSCDAGSYCASEDELCRPDWEPEAFCDEDSDCAMNRVCLGGTCRTPCTSDAQCVMTENELPICRMDAMFDRMLCAPTTPPVLECRKASECEAGEDCLNGTCRNRG